LVTYGQWYKLVANNAIVRKRAMKIHKQQGLSLIGFIAVLSVAIFVSFIGMKIAPLYMEYFSVVNILDGIASEKGSARLSPYEIRVKVMNRLYVNYSENVKESDISIVRANGVILRIAYEVRRPVIGNLDVVTKFDKAVRLAD